MAGDLSYELNIGGIVIKVTPKPIKYLRLKVCRNGEVRASAPLGTSGAEVAAFALSKLSWIKKRRAALVKESSPNYENMETFFVWGKPVPLNIHEDAPRFAVDLNDRGLCAYVRGKADKTKTAALLQAWYEIQTLQEAEKRLVFWSAFPRPKEVALQVRKMKTRWGSCIPLKSKIVLNSELAKKPPLCLDYVVAHELAHFSVPNHSKKFWELLGTFFPGWKEVRKLLNAPPSSAVPYSPPQNAKPNLAERPPSCSFTNDII